MAPPTLSEIKDFKQNQAPKKAPELAPTTRIQKLHKAMKYRVAKSMNPVPEEVDRFFQKVIDTMQECWKK
jgi:hypothetical protein